MKQDILTYSKYMKQDILTDEQCATGDGSWAPGPGFTCKGCGLLFQSPNHHAYAARKRVNARREGGK